MKNKCKTNEQQSDKHRVTLNAHEIKCSTAKATFKNEEHLRSTWTTHTRPVSLHNEHNLFENKDKWATNKWTTYEWHTGPLQIQIQYNIRKWKTNDQLQEDVKTHWRHTIACQTRIKDNMLANVNKINNTSTTNEARMTCAVFESETYMRNN